ncbi:MAG TPA: DUF302 domain-containing protein [Aquifex aeolicus]|nr:DUF302 domain-containing protein [Aquifex aeolicus]
MRSLIFPLLFSVLVARAHPLQWEEVLEGASFGKVKELLVEELETAGFEVVGVLDVSGERPRLSYILFRCMEEVLGKLPQLGAMMPCRVYIHEREDGSTVVGSLNMDTAGRVFGKHLSPEEERLIRDTGVRIRRAVERLRRRL